MHPWQTLGQASPGCSGRGVKHAGSLLYLGWVSTRYPGVGLVTDANLEASGTYKVGVALGLAVGSGGMSLGTTSQQYSLQGNVC